ncbi:hypothetical protein HDU97_003931 [Phlyctochytrium planicorne]|nr:hypothetical protein HDU97_003931 [Phlyctochytrium planicorne]
MGDAPRLGNVSILFEPQKPSQTCLDHQSWVASHPRPIKTSIAVSALPSTNTIATTLPLSAGAPGSLSAAGDSTGVVSAGAGINRAATAGPSGGIIDGPASPSSSGNFGNGDGITPGITGISVSGQQDIAGSSFAKSTGFIAGMTACSVVAVMAAAAFTLLVFRKRRADRKEMVLPLSQEPAERPSPAVPILAQRHDSSSSSSSKRGLLFTEEARSSNWALAARSETGIGKDHSTLFADVAAGGLVGALEVGDDDEKEDGKRGRIGTMVIGLPFEQQYPGDDDEKIVLSRRDDLMQEPEDYTEEGDVGEGGSWNVAAGRFAEGSKSVHHWNVDEVWTWINSIGFREDVADTFKCHNVDGQRLLGLTDRILELELGIKEKKLRSSILTIRGKTFMEGRNLTSSHPVKSSSP